MMKKWDVIIIIILLLISFTPEIILGAKLKADFNSTYAEIKVGGKLYKNIPLSSHKGEESFEIKTKNGVNIIKIVDEKISIIEADCPDKVCMNPKYISKPGQTLVCLPHKVIIEVKGEIDDDIILSY